MEFNHKLISKMKMTPLLRIFKVLKKIINSLLSNFNRQMNSCHYKRIPLINLVINYCKLSKIYKDLNTYLMIQLTN